MTPQFWRSKDFSDTSFLDLVNRTFKTSFTIASEARTWLDNNGYYSSYPNIVTDGLVLNLDAQNIDSFRGEPTENLYEDGNYASGSFHTVRSINGDIIYDPTGFFGSNVLKLNPRTSNQYHGRDISIIIGNTYSVSVWCYVSADFDGSGSLGLYCEQGYSNSIFYNKNRLGEWQKLIIEDRQATTTNGRILCYVLTTFTSGYVLYKNLQFEEKDHATSFVEGTRGTTCETGGGWCDLTGNNHSATLTNSPTQTDQNYISFDGLSNYCLFSSPYTFTTGNGVDYTFEIWFKMRTLPTIQYGSNGHIWGGQNGNNVVIYLNPESGGVSKGVMIYDDSRYYADMMTNGGFTANTWAQWIIIGDGTANTVTHYINGNLDKEDGVVMTGQEVKSWTGTHISYDSRWGTYSELDISIMKQYNRKLTANEVLQNFNAQKFRFGL